MGHPNQTVIVPTNFSENGITEQTKKFILHAATPNNIPISFSVKQKRLISRVDLNSYVNPVYPKPNTVVNSVAYGENTDIAFYKMVSPNFPIIVEKIKICLHQPTNYGCIKINVWDFKDSLINIPTNLIDINSGQTEDYTSPLTIPENYDLVSNVLEQEDFFMKQTLQIATIKTFGYTIAPNSILRFGIQYAEGNGFGLKIFIIGWVIQCD